MGHVTRMRLLPAAVSNRAIASRASRHQPGQSTDESDAVAPPRPRKRAVKKPPGTSK